MIISRQVEDFLHMVYTMIYTICKGVIIMDSAKLFYNGRSQAVRLPREYRFEGEEVFIKKIGSAVVLMPKKQVWEVHEAGVDYFSDDYMESRKQPDQKKRDHL